MKKPIKILFCALLSCAAFAQTPASSRGMSSSSLQSSTALKVRGQRRAMSLAPSARRDKDRLDFLKLRVDYRPEILTTPY